MSQIIEMTQHHARAQMVHAVGTAYDVSLLLGNRPAQQISPGHIPTAINGAGTVEELSALCGIESLADSYGLVSDSDLGPVEQGAVLKQLGLVNAWRVDTEDVSKTQAAVEEDLAPADRVALLKRAGSKG